MNEKFSYSNGTTIEFGLDSLKGLPRIIDSCSAKKILLASDPGVEKAGLLAKIEEILVQSKTGFIKYAEVEADPSTRTIYKMSELAKENGVDLIIAAGGGSAIDAAKGVRVVLDNDCRLEDCAGVNKVKNIKTPMIAIPTTAGTGSEVTRFAVLSNLENDTKFTVSSTLIAPSYAVLDPVMTATLPPKITAYTGFDALTHGIEALTSKIANPISDILALESIKLIFDYLPRAVHQGDDLEARSAMLKAQMLAGIAFDNAMLGLSHAIASPLGAHAHLSHGLANTIMLPYVMEYNYTAAAKKYGMIADALVSKSAEFGDIYEKAYMAVQLVKKLREAVDAPARLSEAGVEEEKLPLIARDALLSVMLKFNVRAASENEILGLVRKAF